MQTKIYAFQIDTTDKLNPKSDSTLLLSSELQRLGFRVFFFQPNKIFTHNNSVFARGSFVEINLGEDIFIIPEPEVIIDLSTAHSIFIRQDPPFNMDYITSLYILKLLETKVHLINSPTAILNNAEKFSPLLFPQYIPITSITNSSSDVISMLSKFQAIVLKPLYGHAGIDIIKIDKDSPASKIDQFIKKHNYVIAQEFLPTANSTDKRVFICCGQIIGSFSRIPATGKLAANLAAGGTALATQLSSRETEIAKEVAKWSLQEKLYIVGLDLIDEKLIEINVTSPTGLQSLNNLYGNQSHVSVINLLLTLSNT